MMIYKQLSQKLDHVCIHFELPAGLWADHVFLVGDFNEWNAAATPFTQARDGKWHALIDLPTHTSHAFYYLIDHLWHNEYHADGWAQAANGQPISMVEATMPKRADEGSWEKFLPTIRQTQAMKVTAPAIKGAIILGAVIN